MRRAIRLPGFEERRGGYELALHSLNPPGDKGIHRGIVVLRRCDVCDDLRRCGTGTCDDGCDDRAGLCLRGLHGLPLGLRRLAGWKAGARKEGEQGGRAERGEQLDADAFQPIP